MKQTEDHSKTAMAVKPIPDGFHTVTPFLIVEGADEFIEFVKKAFHGEVTYYKKGEDGKVMHATMAIGDSTIMLSDAMDRFPPMPCMLHLYVENVDTVYEQAIKSNAASIRPPMDEFYGDRSAGVKDRWDNQWWIATHIEDVSEEEMDKRMKEFQAQAVQ